jgi:hypothetical protein
MECVELARLSRCAMLTVVLAYPASVACLDRACRRERASRASPDAAPRVAFRGKTGTTVTLRVPVSDP